MLLLTLTLLTEEHRITHSKYSQSNEGTRAASDTHSPLRGAQTHNTHKVKKALIQLLTLTFLTEEQRLTTLTK